MWPSLRYSSRLCRHFSALQTSERTRKSWTIPRTSCGATSSPSPRPSSDRLLPPFLQADRQPAGLSRGRQRQPVQGLAGPRHRAALRGASLSPCGRHPRRTTIRARSVPRIPARSRHPVHRIGDSFSGAIPYACLTPNPNSSTQTTSGTWSATGGQRKWPICKCERQNSYPKGSPTKGRVGVSFQAVWAGGSYGRHGGPQPAFTLSALDSAHAVARALWWTASQSGAGIDIALPYFMFCLGGAVCLFKIGFYLAH